MLRSIRSIHSSPFGRGASISYVVDLDLKFSLRGGELPVDDTRNMFAFLVSVPSFLVLTSPIFLARYEGEGYRVIGRRETNAKIVEELNFPACANAKMESWSLD